MDSQYFFAHRHRLLPFVHGKSLVSSRFIFPVPIICSFVEGEVSAILCINSKNEAVFYYRVELPKPCGD